MRFPLSSTVAVLLSTCSLVVASVCNTLTAESIQPALSSGKGSFGIDISRLSHGLIPTAAKLRLKRDVLVCSASETCYILNTDPFCFDISNGYFHSQYGTGNTQTGDYTLTDGKRGNVYKGPYPTPSAVPTTDGSVPTAKATNTWATSTESGSGSGTATATGSAAATRSSGAAGKVRGLGVGAVVVGWGVLFV